MVDAFGEEEGFRYHLSLDQFPALTEELVDEHPEADVPGAVVRKTEDAGVRQLLRTLPPAERLVLYLRFGVGCRPQPWAEVASRLGICERTAHYMAQRGLERLRQEWGETAAA